MEGNFLNIIKPRDENPTANIILSDKQLKARSKTGHLCLPLLFNIVLEVVAKATRRAKEIKGIQIGKEVKLPLFTDDTIFYVENLKDSTYTHMQTPIKTNK